MPRPRTAVDTAGRMSFTGQVQNEGGRWVTSPAGTRPTRWRARAKYRDSDGVLRDVERFAPTRGKAETALRLALKDRQAPVRDAALRPETTVLDAGRHWLSLVARPDSDLSTSTRQQYAANLERYVVGSDIAALTLREVNSVPVLERFLRGVADAHGTGAAKTARTVLSNVLGLAVRYRVLPHNAMRDTRPARAVVVRETDRDTSRAFSKAERDNVLKVAAESPGAVAADVVDLIHFLAGTGVRISEALDLAWADVDLAAGRARVRGTKTKASDRTLSLPEWLTDRLKARAESLGARGLVFASPGTTDRQKPRDRRNVARVVRAVLDAAGCPWATPHTFRRTVATMLDAAGLPIAVAADQLGHADPSMTARAYLGRKGDLSAAAAVL